MYANFEKFGAVIIILQPKVPVATIEKRQALSQAKPGGIFAEIIKVISPLWLRLRCPNY